MSWIDKIEQMVEHICSKKNIQIIVTSFNDTLATSLGTILYGSIFKHNSVSCFCIEDLYYYKGIDDFLFFVLEVLMDYKQHQYLFF